MTGALLNTFDFAQLNLDAGPSGTLTREKEHVCGSYVPTQVVICFWFHGRCRCSLFSKLEPGPCHQGLTVDRRQTLAGSRFKLWKKGWYYIRTRVRVWTAPTTKCTTTTIPKYLLPGIVAPGAYLGGLGGGAWRRPPDPNPTPLTLTGTLWVDLCLDAVACKGFVSRLIRPKADAVDSCGWGVHSSKPLHTRVCVQLFFLEKERFLLWGPEPGHDFLFYFFHDGYPYLCAGSKHEEAILTWTKLMSINYWYWPKCCNPAPGWYSTYGS